MTAWERAVEAAREAKSSSGSVNGVCACSDCDEHRRAILLAAASHLERHFREKLAEELRQKATWLEDLNLAAVDKGRTEPDFALRKKHHEGVRFAADHLTRKEVMG